MMTKEEVIKHFIRGASATKLKITAIRVIFKGMSGAFTTSDLAAYYSNSYTTAKNDIRLGIISGHILKVGYGEKAENGIRPNLYKLTREGESIARELI